MKQLINILARLIVIGSIVFFGAAMLISASTLLHDVSLAHATGAAVLVMVAAATLFGIIGVASTFKFWRDKDEEL